MPRPPDACRSPRPSSTRSTPTPTPTSRSSTVVERPPSTKHVTGSNEVRVHVHLDERTGRIIALIGVEDNLVKGAAGQAVQAFNVVHGLPETTGSSSCPSPRDRDATVRRSRHRRPPSRRSSDARVMPRGFRAGGLAAGIKASGRPDLAVVVATAGPAAAAAVFTPEPRSRPRPSACRRRISRPPPATIRGRWVRLGDRDRLDERLRQRRDRAGGRRRPGARSWPCWPTRPASGRPRPRDLSTGLIGTRLPLDKVAAGLRAIATGAAATDAGLAAAAEALRTTDSVTKVATTTIELPDADGRARAGDGQRHRQGRRDDPPEHGHDALVRADRRRAEPDALWGLLRPGRGAHLGPALASTATRARTTPCSCSRRASGAAPVAPARPRRPRSAPRSRRSAATSPASRPPTARAPRRSSPRAVRRRATTPRPGPSPARSSQQPRQGGGPRPDPNWGRIAGAAGNARLADAAVLEAAGLDREAAGRAPGRRPRSTRRACASRSPGHLVFDGAAGGPLAFDRAAARAAMKAPEVVDRARPRPGRRHRRGLRLRPDRGLRHRELGRTRRERQTVARSSSSAGRRSPSRAQVSRRGRRACATPARRSSSTAAASASPSGSSASASRAASRAASA